MNRHRFFALLLCAVVTIALIAFGADGTARRMTARDQRPQEVVISVPPEHRFLVRPILTIIVEAEAPSPQPELRAPKTAWEKSVVQDGPEITDRWRKTIETLHSQQKSDLPLDLIMSIMLTESMGRPNVANESGAAGLLGVKPVVCEELGITPCNLLDPNTNLTLGMRYLKHLRKKYGFEGATLVLAYGVGPGRAQDILDRIVPSEHSYVRKVDFATAVVKRHSRS